MIDVSEIEARLKKAQARADKARTALDGASAEIARLETALSVVRELMGTNSSISSPESNLTVRQQFVINSLKFSQTNAMSPVEVYQVASANSGFEGDVNYVRTTLWRMADKGQIGSANGAYWRFSEEVVKTEVEAVAPSSEALWGEEPKAPTVNRSAPTTSDN